MLYIFLRTLHTSFLFLLEIFYIFQCLLLWSVMWWQNFSAFSSQSLLKKQWCSAAITKLMLYYKVFNFQKNGICLTAFYNLFRWNWWSIYIRKYLLGYLPIMSSLSLINSLKGWMLVLNDILIALLYCQKYKLECQICYFHIFSGCKN